MNHETWFISEECRGLKVADGESRNNKRWFNPRCVELLNDLTDKTEAKIVVSSTWRLGKTVEQLQDLFSEVGVTGEVIDKTPRLLFTGVEDYSYSVPRGCEIKAWLKTNKGILNVKLSKVKYVIYDDDGDMLWWQRKNFLQVDPYSGLTPSLIHQGKQILL